MVVEPIDAMGNCFGLFFPNSRWMTRSSVCFAIHEYSKAVMPCILHGADIVSGTLGLMEG